MTLTSEQKKGLLSPGSTDEWSTPQKIFDELNEEFGFTLDVCASAENAKCERYFTKQDNALLLSWAGEVCWMNPPYGRQILKWVKKANEEKKRGKTTIVALLPARTDTAWFHDYCVYGSADIRWIRGRLYFNDGVGRCPFPNMIVVFR